MGKIFEDEFMEIQADLISLCLDAVENQVDKIYAYASIERKTTMFNVFFEREKQIMRLDQLGIEDDIQWDVLKTGTAELERVREVCAKYKQKTPTEMKMYYDVNTGAYTANYQYQEISSYKTGILAENVFWDWYEEVKKEIETNKLK